MGARRAEVRRFGPAERNRPADWHRVLSQDLFRDALLRERKRADRFEEAFVLVLVSRESRTAPMSRWTNLVECLLQTTPDADLIGWLEDGAVLGLIRVLPDFGVADTTASVAATIQQDLLRCLRTHNADACSIRLEVYSPKGDAIPPVLFDGAKPRPTLKEIVRDAAKRALDIFGSLALLIAFSPVMLCVAALVKLSSRGPVFFRQQRTGKAGQPFPMLKFRTMHVNADPAIHQQYVEKFIQQSHDTPETGKSVMCKIANDPRVTRVGHFLRRSSLDELPQFLNVLRGEMSLVGPRPPLPYEVARYKRCLLYTSPSPRDS